MNDEVKNIILVLLLIFSLFSYGFGINSATMAMHRYGNVPVSSRCVPKSFGAYINVPYRLGCEMWLPRWSETQNYRSPTVVEGE